MVDYRLSNEDLYYFISQDELMLKSTKGVFPIDKLPTNIYPYKMLLMNTDPAFLPGKHWVCMFIPNNGPSEFFDSIGKNPYQYSKKIVDFLGDTYLYNTVRLQPHNSDTCGLYCLYFLYHRIRNFSFMDILSSFKKDLEYNDEIVIDFYKSFE
jgi:hypothetical protein